MWARYLKENNVKFYIYYVLTGLFIEIIFRRYASMIRLTVVTRAQYNIWMNNTIFYSYATVIVEIK